VVVERGLTAHDDLRRQEHLRARAVANTPNGVAIALDHAFCSPQDGHHHHHHHDHDHDHHHDDALLRPLAVFARDQEESDPIDERSERP
jgi:hypothetical protein